MVDPVSLFEESLAKCSKKCQQSPVAIGLNKFTNGQCKCNLEIKEANKSHKELSQDRKKLNYVKPLSETRYMNSNSSSDESKSFEDQKQIFKPKSLPKAKPLLKAVNQSTLNCNSYPDIDLLKEDDMFSYKNPKSSKYSVHEDLMLDTEDDVKSHKSNVAKITFKTAKEQLLASNPAAKRTLGASRKAQAKFVSPMLGAQ